MVRSTVLGETVKLPRNGNCTPSTMTKAIPANLCAMVVTPDFQRGDLRGGDYAGHAGGRADDLGIHATVVLQAELRQHSEDTQLVDEIGRIQDVQPRGVIRVALDQQMSLEVAHVLDKADEF